MNHRGPPDISGTHSLLVLNISFRTKADQLRQEFARFGDLADVYIPRDRESGESRGFAFVRYFSLEHAEEARKNMDKVFLDNREIAVQIARYGRQPVGHSGPRGPLGRRPRSRSRSPYRGARGRGNPRYDDRYNRRTPPRRNFEDNDRRPPREWSPQRKRFRASDDAPSRIPPADRRSPASIHDDRREPARRDRSPRREQRRESPRRDHATRRDQHSSARRPSNSPQPPPMYHGNGHQRSNSPSPRADYSPSDRAARDDGPDDSYHRRE